MSQEQMQKMFQEVETKFYQTQQELQQVRSQIATKKRDIRVVSIADTELQNQNSERVWEGIGKMFMVVKTDKYLERTAKDKKETEDSITALEKKQHYLETTLKNTTEAINEMMKHTK